MRRASGIGKAGILRLICISGSSKGLLESTLAGGLYIIKGSVKRRRVCCAHQIAPLSDAGEGRVWCGVCGGCFPALLLCLLIAHRHLLSCLLGAKLRRVLLGAGAADACRLLQRRNGHAGLPRGRRAFLDRRIT